MRFEWFGSLPGICLHLALALGAAGATVACSGSSGNGTIPTTGGDDGGSTSQTGDSSVAGGDSAAGGDSTSPPPGQTDSGQVTPPADTGTVVVTEGGVTVADSGALDPALPPGKNFDLSNWELDLPTTPTSTVASAQLVGGFTDDYFFSGSDGAMVMWCPLTGGLTANAHYPRSELREVLNGAAAEWAVTAGTATLTATLAVNQLPPNGIVIVGQIHEGGTGIYPLVKLLYESGNLIANVQLAATSATGTNHMIVSGIGLNQPFAYRIQLLATGSLSISVNDTTETIQIDPSFDGSQLYFKAGSYPQQAVPADAGGSGDGGASTEGSRVSFYSLAVTHT